MAEAIENWPTELHGVPPLETLTSGDGTLRVVFCCRADQTFVFFTQELCRMETDGQEYFVWYPGHLSGLYPDLQAAKREAVQTVSWLRENE